MGSIIPHFGDLFSGITSPLSAALNIGTDLIKSRIISKQNERAQRRIQNNSAELQLKNALKMAEYNSPANMRSRFEAAGYNVGAQMGQLAGTQGQLGAAPSGGAVGLSYSPLNDSQIALNRSAARLNDAKAQTEGTTQELQTATAGLQMVLQKIGLQDERLKAIEVFIQDATKYNQIAMSSASFRTALANLDNLQQEIWNNRRRGHLLDADLATAKSNLVKLGVETILALVKTKETEANIPVLRNLANYYAAQSLDLQEKTRFQYWGTLSLRNRNQADLTRRQYNWMPYLNISTISSQTVRSAADALGIVIDLKTLGLKRAVSESGKSTVKELYNGRGELVGGSSSTTKNIFR